MKTKSHWSQWWSWQARDDQQRGDRDRGVDNLDNLDKATIRGAESCHKKRVRREKRRNRRLSFIRMQFILNDAIPTAYLERLFLGTCYTRNFANASSPFGRHWDSRSCSCSICQSRTSSRDLGTVGHCKDHQLDIARIRHAENPQEPLSLGLYFGTKINVELWLQPWCRCKLQSMQRSSQHMSLVTTVLKEDSRETLNDAF